MGLNGVILLVGASRGVGRKRILGRKVSVVRLGVEESAKKKKKKDQY